MVRYQSGSTLGSSIQTAELDNASVTTAKIADGAVTAAKINGGGLGQNLTINAWQYDSVIGGTWARSVATDQYLAGVIHNISGAADGQGVIYKVFLNAGTYDIAVTHGTGNGKGIIKFKNGSDTVLATLDTYTAGNVESVSTLISGVTVATDGLLTLKVMVDGKNGSSSGYIIFLNGFTFHRTA